MLWKRSKFGVAGLRCYTNLPVTCGDSNLEKIGTRPCLKIAQRLAPKMKMVKPTVIVYLRAQGGCTTTPEIGTGRQC